MHEQPRRLFRKVQVIDFAALLADPKPQRLILDGWFQRIENTTGPIATAF